MDFTGRPLRGMVFVAAAALATDATLQRWVAQARTFVSSRAEPGFKPRLRDLWLEEKRK
jgi:hypothetical protein